MAHRSVRWASATVTDSVLSGGSHVFGAWILVRDVTNHEKQIMKSIAKLSVHSDLSRRDLLKTVAGLGAVAAFSGCTQLDKKPQRARHSSKTSKLLAERAEDYLAQIFEVARGPGRLIISHSHFDTRLPLQENGDIPASLHQVLD